MENSFIEKEFYIEPPDLPKDATDKEKLKAWSDWQKANAKERANHKRKWTKSQECYDLPYLETYSIIKLNGVWKQVAGPLALDGGTDSAHLILYVEPTQDKHFQARGRRGKSNKHRNRRAKRREQKRQKILSRIK